MIACFPLLIICWLKSVNCEACCAGAVAVAFNNYHSPPDSTFIFVNDFNRVAVIINDWDFAITTIVASIVIVREKRFFREWIKKMDTCNIAVND
tara:strand:- start:138 stop:419 length:282 start_codon:yes stop_codon:yes gene_type:complete